LEARRFDSRERDVLRLCVSGGAYGDDVCSPTGGLVTASALTQDERDLVRRSLRAPRGRYDVARASQLSGVPRSTVYEWACVGVLSPDYPGAKPKTWSYRDLVLLRLTVWLRSQGMAREAVVPRVARVRGLLGVGDLRAARVRADARHFFLHGDIVDDSGQSVLDGLMGFIDEFRLNLGASAIAEVGGPVSGPNLVRPSERSRISPWVMAGDPCVRDTRVPTASLWGLREARGLSTVAIARLYPGIDEADVDDAIDLEAHLRRRETAKAA
jgi:uncharacterized protein (DUF433 family)